MLSHREVGRWSRSGEGQEERGLLRQRRLAPILGLKKLTSSNSCSTPFATSPRPDQSTRQTWCPSYRSMPSASGAGFESCGVSLFAPCPPNGCWRGTPRVAGRRASARRADIGAIVGGGCGAMAGEEMVLSTASDQHALHSVRRWE